MNTIDGTQPTPRLPLAVDLDGTLIRTDLLMEGVAASLFRAPLKLFWALLRMLLGGGRPMLKRLLGETGLVDTDALPLREDFVSFLREQREAGRPVYLVTASDARAAQPIADRVGLFDGVIGSRPGLNLKGTAKLKALKERFPDGFVYAGDSAADLKVWRGAAGIILAGATPDTAHQALRLGPPVEARFDNPKAGLRPLMKAMRLHQWAKNALVAIPLILGGLGADLDAIARVLIGIVLVCIAASGTYLLNDLSDLSSDRRHATKKRRPFAAGTLKLSTGLVLAPLMVFGALAAGFWLDLGFGLALLVYLVSTLSYSFGLKRIAFLDVAILGGLYALRLVMGAELAGVPHSPWLLTFAVFFFLSLSLAKRHVEVMKLGEGKAARGRGYHASDWPLTLSWGVASAVAALVILVLYLVEEAFVAGLYVREGFLWVAPVMVGLWTMRVWLLAHRRILDDDPVAFAVRDKVSIGLGVVMGLGFLAAALPLGVSP